MRRLSLLLLLLPTMVVAQSICAIQGSGISSPFEGQQVTTEGIVTAVYTGTGSINGYYIEQPACDGSVNTSNGIFVYAPNTGVSIGQRLSVTGTVLEFNGLTEISNATHSVLGSGVVNPTEIDLPIASLASWERYEGMLVRFPGMLVVVDNSSWSQYGELYLARERTYAPTNEVDPNDVDPTGTTFTGAGNVGAVQAAQNVIDRGFILLDDTRTSAWPDPAPWADVAGTLRNGSTVNDLTGVIHYSYGEYKLEPVAPVLFQHAERPVVPAVGGSLRAAAFNVLNYFTTLGDWGATNSAELGRQRAKLVAAIEAMNADVLVLCEIENTDAAWQDLVAALNNAMGVGTYAVLEEDAFGQGTRTVILYKPSVLLPVTSLYALNTNLFQRPHLTQGFRVISTGGRFLFSTMHLRSKLCDGAAGTNTDQGDGQGCFNAMRRSQADALVDHWAEVRNATGIAAQLIMGDFNAYAEEDPIDRLRASGLHYRSVVGGYTHTYGSMFGTLDHVFATATMDAAVTGTAIWHINTDEPETFDYRDGNVLRYQANAFRSSDHDPVLVGFEGGQLSVGLAERSERSPVTFTQAGERVRWVLNDQRATGMVQLLDPAGRLVRAWSFNGGVAEAHLTGLATGCYAWRIPGLGSGRFLLP